MKKVFFFGLIVIAFGTASVLSAGAGAAQSAVTGTILGGNIAKAKDGFRFNRIGSREAQVERTSNLQIMGSYSCIAPKAGDSTGCSLHVNPTVVECQGTAANGGVCQLKPHQTQRLQLRR